MDELKGLVTDKWYQALAILSALLAGSAAAVGNDAGLRKALVLLGVGGFLIGLGQWIDHPYRERLVPGAKISGFLYQPSIAGSLVMLLGLVLCGRALWLVW